MLAEVAWVLRAAYRWDRATIHERLSRLVRTRGVEVEDLALVETALAAYRNGPAELPDHLIVESARAVRANLLTFDRRLAREPGVRLLRS